MSDFVCVTSRVSLTGIVGVSTVYAKIVFMSKLNSLINQSRRINKINQNQEGHVKQLVSVQRINLWYPELTTSASIGLGAPVNSGIKIISKLELLAIKHK